MRREGGRRHFCRTSLGEKGGESVVIVGRLALLGEVTIRLVVNVSRALRVLRFAVDVPGYRAQGSKAKKKCQPSAPF